MEPKEIIKRVFVVELSTKTRVKIDPTEIDAVLQGIAEGKLVKVKQGVINPSFIVGIVEDTERRVEFLEDTKYDTERRGNGIKPLVDIFPNVKRNQLPSPMR